MRDSEDDSESDHGDSSDSEDEQPTCVSADAMEEKLLKAALHVQRAQAQRL
jgi:hypothetical protein